MSFSNRVKNEILNIKQKSKPCCSYALLYGILLFALGGEGIDFVFSTNVENRDLFINTCNELKLSKRFDYKVENRKMSITTGFIRYFTIAEIKENIFKCPHCKENFLKGIFLMRGSISDPEKCYRLDIVFDNEEQSEQMRELLLGDGVEFKTVRRSSKSVLYLRRSESIEDFLALIGANNAVFDLINEKINKEIRNTANRVTNCDSANITKSINASAKYISAIKWLKDNGHFDKLSDGLKEIATIRLENEEVSLSELGKRFSPPITKSGVCHRLEKLYSTYEELKNKN